MCKFYKFYICAVVGIIIENNFNLVSLHSPKIKSYPTQMFLTATRDHVFWLSVRAVEIMRELQESKGFINKYVSISFSDSLNTNEN